MTPGARFAAAIEILDQWLAGERAERALTRWARANRFAGSKDRAAIRDHVYDAIRQKRSLHAWGGAGTGRGLILGSIRQVGDPADIFTGTHYDPPELSKAEANWDGPPPMGDAERLDWPDWLWDDIGPVLGEGREAALTQMRLRAPVFLRVNSLKATRDEAIAALAAEDITCQPHELAETALLVTTNARRVAQSAAFKQGLVELQDTASQAVVDHAGPRPGETVLDYCAGGGGKTLALAAATGDEVWAHDASPTRMGDLPARARRAGAKVKIVQSADELARKFDLVLCDAPCSGSGSWRRDREGKWRLTPDALKELTRTQAEILRKAAPLVHETGRMAYVTCSMLPAENKTQIDAFLSEHANWRLASERQFTPLDGGDGFYVAILTQSPVAL